MGEKVVLAPKTTILPMISRGAVGGAAAASGVVDRCGLVSTVINLLAGGGEREG
jgi:hypothetical protein